jgi:hypothetical protein
MTDPDRFDHLLRAALPPTVQGEPDRNLWSRVVDRLDAPRQWSWVDLSLAAMVAIALLMFPEGLFLLAYHL